MKLDIFNLCLPKLQFLATKKDVPACCGVHIPLKTLWQLCQMRMESLNPMLMLTTSQWPAVWCKHVRDQRGVLQADKYMVSYTGVVNCSLSIYCDSRNCHLHSVSKKETCTTVMTLAKKDNRNKKPKPQANSVLDEQLMVRLSWTYSWY